MQVTNGSVTFGRTVKPADYEGKKVEVTLSFVIPEGEDAEAAIGQVSVLAHDRAMVLLSMPDRAVGAIPLGDQTVPAQTSTNVKEPPTTRRRRNPAEVTIGSKTPDPADIGGEPSSTATPSPTASSPPSGGDPADIADVGPTSSAISGASSTASASAEDWEHVEPAKVPTEVDLVDACKQANARLGNPVPIRALIAEYAGPPPKGSKDVPAEKRAEFLAKLNALQPTAKAA